MSATQEMIKQNVLNWLDALVIGVKAMNTEVVCGVVDDDRDLWRVTASTYDQPKYDGLISIHVHDVKLIAKATELDLQHRDFTPMDNYYRSFTGEDFFVYNGVRFADMILGGFSNDEEKSREQEMENARKQSGDSRTPEEVSVADE